jgi:hypothetical protein
VTDTTTSSPVHPDPVSFDGLTGELTAIMAAYTPAGLPGSVWDSVAPACIAVVQRAGPAKAERVLKDLQILAKIAAVLRERNRPVTVEEMLSDGALRDLDHAELQAGLAEKTRLNHRAIARRLQATHRGLPWQVGRRKEHTRPSVEPAGRVDELARRAGQDSGDDARAFEAVVAASDRARAEGTSPAKLDRAVWQAARRFAAVHDVRLTQAMIKDAATMRVLAQSAPVADLIARYQLTRRDLDLLVAASAALPDCLDDSRARVLRGADCTL